MDSLFRSFFRSYIGKNNVPNEEIPDFTPGCGADFIVRNQLMNERPRGVIYPPAMWNLYERTLNGQSRTKKEQEFAMHSLREYTVNHSRGLRQRPQRYRYRLHSKEFMDIVHRWDSNDDPVQYLRTLAPHSQSLDSCNVDPGEDCDDEDNAEESAQTD